MSFSQLAGKAYIQMDTLISDEGKVLNYLVKGYLFTSDSTCRSFNFSRDNSYLDLSFNDEQSLKKNIKVFIKTYAVERFESIEAFTFTIEKLESHQLIRFQSGISFNPILPSDLLILKDQMIEIYVGEEDCEHCYHSQETNMYFFLYDDFKLSRKYRKMVKG
ncbi:MAG: hypothetical protein ACI9N1_000150 [Flavobacteriales bacterium]|jgi:hypothetical protein